nr:hypothetical protein Q903MT_gene5948 [Picea sitchensis]
MHLMPTCPIQTKTINMHLINTTLQTDTYAYYLYNNDLRAHNTTFTP